MGFESPPEPRLPLNITYAFSSSLLQYTLTVDACGLPYSVPVGNLISQTFMDVGMERFQTVQAEPPVGQAKGAPPDGYRILLTLNQFAFDPVTKMGQEDRYQAFVDMNMQAVYEDPQGTALAQSPLIYHQKVSLWTPELTSQSTSCSTTQIDGTVKSAAEVLAKDMISVLPRLTQATAPGTPTTPNAQTNMSPPGTTNTAQPSQAPTAVKAEVSPAVQFRTKLLDANRNLALEGGEAIILLIETTNVSDATIPSAYVELRGTPVLVEGFKRVAPIPIPLGSLKPGEKRTTEIRGRLGQVIERIQGELTIGIIVSEGLPPGTHSIRVEIQPGPTRK
ncbi:MAG: hypothetical protein AB7P17_08970 [Nitrospirales bacterium]|nr:hypothetical protein [Nitrospirales bacterium]